MQGCLMALFGLYPLARRRAKNFLLFGFLAFLGCVALCLAVGKRPSDSPSPDGSATLSTAASEKPIFPPSEMPLNTFLATRPDGPKRFRLLGRLSSTLPLIFDYAPGSYYGVELFEEDGSGFVIGCISKTGPDSQRLFELLKDSKKHTLSLNLESVGPNGSRITDGNALTIAKYYGGH